MTEISTDTEFFILFRGCFPVCFCPSESLYAHGSRIEPHVRLWSPAKRPGVCCTANAVMRTPFSSTLLPPFLHSLWTTPKQEVHFLFFLNKKNPTDSFRPRLTCTAGYPTRRTHFQSLSYLFCNTSIFMIMSVNLYKDITSRVKYFNGRSRVYIKFIPIKIFGIIDL